MAKGGRPHQRTAALARIGSIVGLLGCSSGHQPGPAPLDVSTLPAPPLSSAAGSSDASAAPEPVDGSPSVDVDLPQTITVATRRGGQALSNADVVFNAADGTIVAHVLTGEDGMVVVSSSKVASVTARGATPSGDSTLFTWNDVAPGDSLILDLPPSQDEQTQASIALPGPYPDATTYGLTACTLDTIDASASGPNALLIPPSCFEGDAQFFVTAVAYVGDAAAAFSTSPLPTPDGGIDDGGIDATLPAWSSSWTTMDITLVDPSTVTAAVALALDAEIDGTLVATPSDAVPLPSSGFPVHVSPLIPSTPSAGVRLALTASSSSNGITRTSLVASHELLSGGPVTIDVGASLLPSIQVDSVDVTNPLQPSVRWSATSDVSQTDAVLVVFSWPSTSGSTTWVVAGPPDASRPIVIPQLPSLPPPFPTLSAGWPAPQISVLDRQGWLGYRDYRQHDGLAVLENPLAPDGQPPSRLRIATTSTTP